MANPICEYCDHEFTDREITDGDRHMLLAIIEISCPVCHGHTRVSFEDIVNKEGEVSE